MSAEAINTHGNYTPPAVAKENYLSEKDSEFNRFGIVSMAVIAVGIFGGIVVGLGGIESDFALITVITTTMTTLSLVLAVMPMKYILSSVLLAVIVDILFIISFML